MGSSSPGKRSAALPRLPEARRSVGFMRAQELAWFPHLLTCYPSNGKEPQDLAESESKSAWSTLIEGGIPQVLAGPAGKVISRLIGSFAEIPTTKIEGVSQGIRDVTDARSIVSRAIAEKVAERATADPDIIERAMDNLLAKEIRFQNNKEAVARSAVEELSRTPSSSDIPPSDDWMNKFERYVEDASSEELRLMYGKILAGEVRRPGSFSPSTLHFISLLDQETAALIREVMPYATDRGAVYLDSDELEISVEQITTLEQCGFLSNGKARNLEINLEGYTIELTRLDRGFVVIGEADTSVSVPAAIMSRAGRELVSVVSPEFSHVSVARLFMKNGATEVGVGTVEMLEANRVRLSNISMLNI